MEVDGPSHVLPLRRGGPGCWRTRDGLWDIVLDPTDWRELGIVGLSTPRRAWYIYPAKGCHPGADSSLPAFVGGTRAWGTLRDAAEALRGAETVDVEPLE